MIMIIKLLPVILFAFGAFGAVLDEPNNLYTKGDMRGAAALYKKAAREGENPTLCYFNLANAYFQSDSLAQALVYYKACVETAPEFFRGRLNLAIAYYTLDDLGECIAEAKRAVELDGENQKALFILAAAYRKANALPEAIVAFEQLAQAFPDMEEPCVALGEMYRELGDPIEAVKWFAQYPQSGKNGAYVQRALAEIYESENDMVRALFCLQKSFEKDHGQPWVYYRMVELNEKSGNALVALENAKEGVRLFPKFPDLALLAGTIAFKLERYDEARRYYDIARKNGSAAAIVGLDNVIMMKKGKLKNPGNGASNP